MISIGQKFWFLSLNRYKSPSVVTVTKVGRTLFTVGTGDGMTYQVEKDTLIVRGRGSHFFPGILSRSYDGKEEAGE